VTGPPPAKPQRKWYRVDLHLHTPASHDYEEPGVSYLEWMRTVVDRGLDIVAITDHNTVAGIARIRQELEWLTRLEQDGRLSEEERARLNEWRDLAGKVMVLPGFEFTATFGFHILGIFPPDTPLRQLEHVLLQLKVPFEKLDWGSTETGASTDVLNAYKIIHDAGGLVIASHANSTHGVAMRNFPFGGQTKIAYTQDANLDALEVTDLDKHRFSTARFFNGTKTEYARRMHCIQGSDAHRITGDPKNPKRLGIGERPTEMLLEAPSFEAIKELLRSNHFDRTRRALPPDKPFDPIEAAREEGPSIVLSFHESASQRGGKLMAILADICAFANTAGGTIFVGANPRKDKTKGLANPKEVEEEIRTALSERLTPPLEIKIDKVQSQDATVLWLRVPKGNDRPYCLDDSKFYVRDESETSLAVRDEIIALVRDVLSEQGWRSKAGRADGATPEKSGQSPRDRGQRREPKNIGANENGGARELTPADGAPVGALPVASTVAAPEDAFYLPQIGVEIVQVGERNSTRVYSIRDLRNGHVIHNVTRKGARKLWNYAIGQYEDKPIRPDKIQWRGNVGLVVAETRAGKVRYDLARREGDRIRVFYGVSDEGMEGEWAAFVQEEEGAL
jgi:hypothetical protein